MTDYPLALLGGGIETDGYSDVRALPATLPPDTRIESFLASADPVDPAVLAPHDSLTRSAIAALHQAATMAGGISGNDTALLVVTAWGMIDATVAYLESMLDADGRYASPRYFTRSVYSAPASALAIHFQIHGPCQTLAFDAAENPVHGALAQAARLLAAKRAQRVAIVWAEQAGELAEDLAERAATKLHRREFARYRNHNLGRGATAMVVAAAPQPAAIATFQLASPYPVQSQPNRGKPFAMDEAPLLLSNLLRPRSGTPT